MWFGNRKKNKKENAPSFPFWPMACSSPGLLSPPPLLTAWASCHRPSWSLPFPLSLTRPRPKPQPSRVRLARSAAEAARAPPYSLCHSGPALVDADRWGPLSALSSTFGRDPPGLHRRRPGVRARPDVVPCRAAHAALSHKSRSRIAPPSEPLLVP